MSQQHPVERHPLKPFIPYGARVLMLGSFPPPHERWSMEFFYPNFINDMWRIFGLLAYGDREHFTDGKKFDRAKVMEFCRDQGIAIYDAASAVRRLKANASDAFLEVVEHTDIVALLEEMPRCRDIVSTGGKSAEAIAEALGCHVPAVGNFVQCGERRFWRMPSSSRAYPLPLQKKAEAYSRLFPSFLQVRDSRPEDIPMMQELFEAARGIMRSTGNMHQWEGGYPSDAQLLSDISRGVSHMVEERMPDGTLKAVGTFAFIPGEDPTYKVIYDGAWIAPDLPYGTIHRLASTPQSHGVAAACFRWCRRQTQDLRIDTHRDNSVMRHVIESAGFTYCGIIHLLSGDERLAYQIGTSNFASL